MKTLLPRIITLMLLLCLASAPRFTRAQILTPTTQPATPTAEQWGIFELTLKGPTTGNPFTDVSLSATFTLGGGAKKLEVPGFYDGDGNYRIRFMPPDQGDWQYQTHSSLPALDAQSGRLQATKPSATNHGPVIVAPPPRGLHFSYADGAPYYPFGTTCYAWVHQGDALEEQTLATLKTAPFNKVRMCIFPKHMEYNNNEPVYYPFPETPNGQWDFTRFNPEFFRHIEKRVGQLRDLGIEADIILFHPYDRSQWGFDTMTPDTDDRYLRYVLARLSAYRNVWWSLANEYDIMLRNKPMATWDHFFDIVVKSDPYAHLRSVHNNNRMYNLNAPYVTHGSVQNGEALEDFGRALLYRLTYNKPIVMDEVAYEGDIPARWGNLSPQEMVRRFWIGIVSGVYVTHGETFLDPSGKDILWWAKGGVLHGQSPARIAFLRKLVESMGPMDVIDKWEDVQLAGSAGRYYLRYFGKETPTEWVFDLPRPAMRAGLRFHVDVIDTWDMTITPVEQVYTTTQFNMYHWHAQDNAAIKLPGKPYMAVRITPLDN